MCNIIFCNKIRILLKAISQNNFNNNIIFSYDYKYEHISHPRWFRDIHTSVMACQEFMDSHKMSMPSVASIPRYNLAPAISAYIMLEIPGHRASFICTQCIHATVHYTPRICRIDIRDARYADWYMTKLCHAICFIGSTCL